MYFFLLSNITKDFPFHPETQQVFLKQKACTQRKNKALFFCCTHFVNCSYATQGSVWRGRRSVHHWCHLVMFWSFPQEIGIGAANIHYYKTLNDLLNIANLKQTNTSILIGEIHQERKCIQLSGTPHTKWGPVNEGKAQGYNTIVL